MLTMTYGSAFLFASLSIDRVPSDRTLLSLVERIKLRDVLRGEGEIEHGCVRGDARRLRGLGEHDEAGIPLAWFAKGRY